MLKANSYSGVCRILGERFSVYRRNDVNITGLIFGIPGTPLGKSDYLPIVDYWHNRSDNVTDFFCAGFFEQGAVIPAPTDAQVIEEIRHGQWLFSSELLARFVGEIEDLSSWKPSGGFDVIVCTARHAKPDGPATLDFSSAICITLEDAKKSNAVRDLSHLLTLVFEFAKSINEETSDAAWEFSDERGFHVLKTTLREMFESWIPKWLSRAGREAEVFAVHDITPKGKT